MKTLIISGGNIDSDFALAFMKETAYDYMIVADRGLEFVQEHHLKPNLIVGDFDSVDESIIAAFREKASVPIRTYNPVKDATDTEIAIEKALAQGCEQLWILGATGTRIDHILGNICCLKLPFERGCEAFLVDAYNKIRLVGSGQKLKLKKTEQFGKYISLIPFGEAVSGVTLRGFKYPLTEITLTNRGSLGVSNEITEDLATVEVGEGIVILIESRDRN